MRRLTLSLLLLASGCVHLNAAQATGLHHGLDVVTGAVDPAYSLAAKGCDAREAVVIAQAGTTEEQDQAELDHIRANCDRIFAAFEGIRQAQLTARAAVDAARESDEADALTTALRAVEHVTASWRALAQVIP